jgi:hypothetical protein
VSLSAIASLSLSQNSLFNEIASATKGSNSTSSSVVPAAGSTAISTDGANSTNGTSPSDALANDLAALLQSLGSGDVNGAKAALKKVEADLQAQSSANATPSSTPSNSSTASTSSSSQTSNPLTNLLNQLSSALNSGDTNSALQDLTTFLVATGQGAGSAVNLTA